MTPRRDRATALILLGLLALTIGSRFFASIAPAADVLDEWVMPGSSLPDLDGFAWTAGGLIACFVGVVSRFRSAPGRFCEAAQGVAIAALIIPAAATAFLVAGSLWLGAPLDVLLVAARDAVIAGIVLHEARRPEVPELPPIPHTGEIEVPHE